MSGARGGSAAALELFSKRLLVVVGKGGVGKTTVAASLALAAARSGRRTLLAEVDGVGRAGALLGAPAGEIGSATAVRPGLSVMSVEGGAALAEYLQLIVPIRRVIKAVLDSQLYQYFVAAAPGLKELMTIGKIWYEADQLGEDGRPKWDLVILDAPATGHGLQYLEMPRAAHDVFEGGLVGRESQRLLDLLTDPARCAVNLVTIPEEMPVTETVEMCERLRDRLAMPLGCVFANRVHDTPLRATDIEELRARLTDLPEGALGDTEAALLQEVEARAGMELGWADVHRTMLERLRELGLPLVELPFLFAEEFGQSELKLLSGRVETAVGGGA